MSYRLALIQKDILAGLVVFLVALPLCLGISLACGVPLISGMITGIVAGLVVSILSGSELSVSGPAAGLTAIVIAGIHTIGSFEGLLVATALSGALQIALGVLRMGSLATLFPFSVIKGMMAGIGAIIITKQIPYALGWNGSGISIGALIIAVISICVMIFWDSQAKTKGGFFQRLPGPLLAVLSGVFINAILLAIYPNLALSAARGELVSIPVLAGFRDMVALAPSPSIHWLYERSVWMVAVTIAVIGSIETLLCLKASDKLDPLGRTSKLNRELVAQGVGNMLAGCLGGIPMTSVIVRTSANIYSGARSRLASFIHGALLFSSIVAIPVLLNMIPLAALAAVLLVVGYKLVDPKLIKDICSVGMHQSAPFIVTACGALFIDLLTGVLLGTVTAFVTALPRHRYASFSLSSAGREHLLQFKRELTFLQKRGLKRALDSLPNGSSVRIDGGGLGRIDDDILDVIESFLRSTAARSIEARIESFHCTKLARIVATLENTQRL
jgi:MFS superfamily sulfate permease-like transporter